MIGDAAKGVYEPCRNLKGAKHATSFYEVSISCCRCLDGIICTDERGAECISLKQNSESV